MIEDKFENLRKKVQEEKRVIRELINMKKNLQKVSADEEKRMASSHIKSLEIVLKRLNEEVDMEINRISFPRALPSVRNTEIGEISVPKTLEKKQKVSGEEKIEAKKSIRKDKWEGEKPIELERKIIRRFRKAEEEIIYKKAEKPSKYVNISSRMFSNFSLSLIKKGYFRSLERDLQKSNLQFLPRSYISVTVFTTLLSIIFAIVLFFFFMFFNIGAELPIITLVTESFLERFLKVFWLLFAVPVATFLIMFNYPGMERAAAENRINQELPFATIHMSAISGSMIDPSKIFEIIISTKEYPFIQREFVKLMNEINIYGYDLISALRRSAFNSPSTRLAELFNGIATTITSGGDLPEFFNKRSQSLLLDYRLEREKYARSAETFMDIYISVVIAAPMILMLLLMMMKVSGLGISLSVGMISLIMILGVSAVNIIFLTFLHLRQPVG